VFKEIVGGKPVHDKCMYKLHLPCPNIQLVLSTINIIHIQLLICIVAVPLLYSVNILHDLKQK